MISEKDREKIKKILGWRYSAEIVEHLKEQDILNLKNEPYSQSSVIKVMNGRNNTIIESAIFDLVNKRLKEQKKQEKILSKI